MTKFRVVRIDNGHDNPHTGIVSNHRTQEAAQAAIDKANRGLRSLPGCRGAWHPYAIEQALPVPFTDGTSGMAWERVR